MNREYQGDQILQQGTKQSQNLVQNDITGDINSNQQNVQNQQRMDITQISKIQNNQVTQDSNQPQHNFQQQIEFQNLLANQDVNLTNSQPMGETGSIQNPQVIKKDGKMKKRDIKYSEKKDFPNEQDGEKMNQPIQGQDKIISQNNNFQIPQNIPRQVLTQKQQQSQSHQQMTESMDQDGSEEIDIMKMMKEPHSKSETERSHQIDQKTEKNASTTFKKFQTKILQKWFLDNISHPYLKKDDKMQLANETGLSKKQITGWFTNNRKRKYQKVAAIAKKKNKDFNYVRDIIKMKFDKDLDQSISSNTDNAGETDSKKNSEVTKFAEKIWGNNPDKQQIFSQLNANKSQIEVLQQQMNLNDSKGQLQQQSNKDNQINLNEILGNDILGKRNSARMIKSIGNAGNPMLNQSQFQLQAKNIINSQNLVNQSQPNQPTINSSKQIMPQSITDAGKSGVQTPQEAAAAGQNTGKINTGSQFTFNGTFDNLTVAQAQQVHQANETGQSPSDVIRDHENQQAQKILENLSKLFVQQKVQNYLAPGKEPKKGGDSLKPKQSDMNSDNRRESKSKGNEKSQDQINSQSMLSQKIKYIPILYVKCPKAGTPTYEPLFDLRQQINQYLQFFFKQKESRSSENKQMEISDDINSGSDQTNSQNRQQQINQIEGYVDNFIKNFIGGQTLSSNQSPPQVPKDSANKVAPSQSNTNMQQSTNGGGSVIQPTQVQMSNLVSGSSQKDIDFKKILMTTLKGSQFNIKEGQNNQKNIQKFQTLPQQKEGNKNHNDLQEALNLDEKREIGNFFNLYEQNGVQSQVNSQNLKKSDTQNTPANRAGAHKNNQYNQLSKIQQPMGGNTKGQNQMPDQQNQKAVNSNNQKNAGGPYQSQNNSNNNASNLVGNGNNSSSGIHSGHILGTLNVGYPSSQSNINTISNPNSNLQNSNQGTNNSNGSNGSKKSGGSNEQNNGQGLIQNKDKMQGQAEGLKMDKKAVSQQNLQDQHKSVDNQQRDQQTANQKMKNAETPEVKHHQNMLGSGQAEGQHLNSDKFAGKSQKLDQANKDQQIPYSVNPDQTAQTLINQLMMAQRNNGSNGNESNVLQLLETFLRAYGTNNTAESFDPQAALNLIQGLKNLKPNNDQQDTNFNVGNDQQAPRSSSKKHSDLSNFQVEHFPIQFKSNSTYQAKSTSLQRQSGNGNQNIMNQSENNQNYASQMDSNQQQHNLLTQMQNINSPNFFVPNTGNIQFQNFMNQINSQYNQPTNLNNFDQNNFVTGNMNTSDLIGLQNMQMAQASSENQMGGFKSQQYSQNQHDLNQTQQLIHQNFPGFNQQYQNLFANPNMDMSYQQQKQPNKDKSRQRGNSNQPEIQSDRQFENIYMGSNQMNNGQKLNTSYSSQQNGFYNNMQQ